MVGSATVSAALIVRDESKFISDCLRSLVDHVDEIVVVDTGSGDDTIAIASRFPVNLYQFPWCGDFSAARNYALDRAASDWILYIDADERLAIPDRDEFHRLLADRRQVAWKLRLHPRVGWTAYSELRLFRNDQRIRFHGVIHERIWPGVEAVARADDLGVGLCDVALHHVGYEADQSFKNSRNIPLLRTYLSRDPNRLYCCWHLGECLRLSGDDEGAIDAWTNGIARRRDFKADDRRLDSGVLDDSILYVSLLKLKHARGDGIDELAAEALARFPAQLAIQWLAALIALERGDFAAASAILERLTAIDADTFFDPRIADDKALFRHDSAEPLALCYFRTGRFADAARLYRIAASTAPDPAGLELKARLSELRAARQQ
jgi:glycosyltransferase involved in cell wall biosynthesis